MKKKIFTLFISLFACSGLWSQPARSFVNIPGFYCWGYNDNVCPPTSMYAAYNVTSGEKELMLLQETGHWLYPEESIATEKWLLKKLGVN